MNIELLLPIASMTVATRARRVVDWISTSSVAQRTQRDCHHRNEGDQRSNSNLQSHFNCQARNRTSNSFKCQTSNSRTSSNNSREKRQWTKRSSASTTAHAGGRARLTVVWGSTRDRRNAEAKKSCVVVQTVDIANHKVSLAIIGQRLKLGSGCNWAYKN